MSFFIIGLWEISCLRFFWRWIGIFLTPQEFFKDWNLWPRTYFLKFIDLAREEFLLIEFKSTVIWKGERSFYISISSQNICRKVKENLKRNLTYYEKSQTNKFWFHNSKIYFKNLSRSSPKQKQIFWPQTVFSGRLIWASRYWDLDIMKG